MHTWVQTWAASRASCPYKQQDIWTKGSAALLAHQSGMSLLTSVGRFVRDRGEAFKKRWLSFFLNSTDKWGDLRGLETGAWWFVQMWEERDDATKRHDPSKASMIHKKRDKDNLRAREWWKMSTKDVKSEKCNLVLPGFRGHMRDGGKVAGSQAGGRKEHDILFFDISIYFDPCFYFQVLEDACSNAKCPALCGHNVLFCVRPNT